MIHIYIYIYHYISLNNISNIKSEKFKYLLIKLKNNGCDKHFNYNNLMTKSQNSIYHIKNLIQRKTLSIDNILQ
jgi:hypothetical protein